MTYVISQHTTSYKITLDASGEREKKAELVSTTSLKVSLQIKLLILINLSSLELLM